MPQFSLVIPTLKRADTFRHALATLLDQTSTDLEIVVQNNGRDQEISSIVEQLGTPRIRCFSTESILPMTENWELALNNTSGDFITFLGDDDGLFPDACEVAAHALDLTGAEIVSWRPFCYYWPDYLQPEMRNRLIATVNHDFKVRIIDSEWKLRQVYRFAVDYSELPMIYNSFVARSVVERVKRLTGRYFLGSAPDVASGIVDAANTSHFALLWRPLSITGLSHHSVGQTAFSSPRSAAVSPEWIRRNLGEVTLDSRLVSADNILIFLANEMLYLKNKAFPNRAIELDFHGLVEAMARAINDRRGFYEETLFAIQELAKRYKIDLAEVSVPARTDYKPILECGEMVLGRNQRRYVIDGHDKGIATIADATKVAAPLISHPGQDDQIEVEVQNSKPVHLGQPVTFDVYGNGVSALLSGWGEPEEGGTWSIGKRAIIQLSVKDKKTFPARATIKFMPFLHGPHNQLDVRCRSHNAELVSWICSEASWQSVDFTIPAEAVAADSTVYLEILISNPCSPAELGISADARQLGIRIARLEFDQTRIEDSGSS